MSLIVCRRGAIGSLLLLRRLRRCRRSDQLTRPRDGLGLRRKRFLWSRFTDLLERYPLPAARIIHRYTNVSKARP